MQLIQLPTRYSPNIYRLWVSPSGRRLIALTGHIGGANRLRSWNVPNGKSLGRRVVVTDPERDNGFPWPAFDRTLRFMLFDKHVEDRKTRKRVKLEYVFYERTLGPDGVTAFALADDYRINRFPLPWGFKGRTTTVRADKSRALHQNPERYAEQLTVSPAGDLLVVRSSKDDLLWPFRLPTGEPLPAVELPVFKTDGVRMTDSPYGRLLVSPDGRMVASAGDGVVVCDPLSPGSARTLDERHFADLAFTPDGSRLVGVRTDAAVVWDVAAGGVLAEFDFRPRCGPTRAVAVFPDGLTAVAGGTNGRLVRWDL